MTPRLSPEELRAALAAWQRDELPDALEQLARRTFVLWRARAITSYMRDAGPPPPRGEPRRRRKDDTGPLRIVSGTLARAVAAGGPNAPARGQASGLIERARIAAGRLELEKGVGLRAVPYARIHELGGRAGRAMIPARPYLRPSLADIREQAAREATERLAESLARALRRGGTASPAP